MELNIICTTVSAEVMLSIRTHSRVMPTAPIQYSGYFYEEPKNMLRQEFRDVSLYFAILGAAAHS